MGARVGSSVKFQDPEVLGKWAQAYNVQHVRLGAVGQLLEVTFCPAPQLTDETSLAAHGAGAPTSDDEEDGEKRNGYDDALERFIEVGSS
jgi:hypothetical protein